MPEAKKVTKKKPDKECSISEGPCGKCTPHACGQIITKDSCPPQAACNMGGSEGPCGICPPSSCGQTITKGGGKEKKPKKK